MTKDHTEQWRAEQDDCGSWNVLTDYEIILRHLDEPTARLIAAAPAVTKELEDWYRICTNPQISSETYWNSWKARTERIEAALTKAGRAPE